MHSANEMQTARGRWHTDRQARQRAERRLTVARPWSKPLESYQQLAVLCPQGVQLLPLLLNPLRWYCNPITVRNITIGDHDKARVSKPCGETTNHKRQACTAQGQYAHKPEEKTQNTFRRRPTEMHSAPVLQLVRVPTASQLCHEGGRDLLAVTF